ncbi:MAG: hypothetical protein COU51_01830 [Parcubacteria group bacterium CG10_big_fil_rev_8_21_14_0_10_36_14]|nr:MAG: hypothetical protein COU51_01830 [Parcubacteria group bacterium CG10_big_fil_rev_8_21_14_0_10_36_14]
MFLVSEFECVDFIGSYNKLREETRGAKKLKFFVVLVKRNEWSLFLSLFYDNICDSLKRVASVKIVAVCVIAQRARRFCVAHCGSPVLRRNLWGLCQIGVPAKIWGFKAFPSTFCSLIYF